jgi:hypothetical protein
MRPQRDIESVLDAWLAPGPTEMPDRLFHDALERIERTPQRRLAWTPRRFTTMFASFKFATAAVIAGLVFALVGLSLWQSSDVQQAPAASPSPDASSAPLHAPPGDPIVRPLSGRYAGPPRSVDGLVLDDILAYWNVDLYGFWVDVVEGTDLGSFATQIGPGLVRFESKSGDEGCAVGSVGTYAWTLSAGDTRIAIEPVEDACPARAEFLTGAWTRVGYCDVEYRDCTGNLPAGRFEPAMFAPRQSTDGEPSTGPGTFSFEVPDGWANDFESLDGYQLTTSKGYAREAAGAATGADALWVSPRPAAVLPGYDKDCNPTLDTSQDQSVEGLVGWLSSHPNLTLADEPSTMTIDGHPATVIDFDVDADATTDAPDGCFGDIRDFPLFADAWAFKSSGAWDTDRWSWDVRTSAGDAWRVIILDLDGQPVVIILDSADPTDRAAWVEQAMPVVESFQFPA